jgi:hypothetical protein
LPLRATPATPRTHHGGMPLAQAACFAQSQKQDVFRARRGPRAFIDDARAVLRAPPGVAREPAFLPPSRRKKS